MALLTPLAALKGALESRLQGGRAGWGHPSCLPLSPSSWLAAAVLRDVEQHSLNYCSALLISALESGEARSCSGARAQLSWVIASPTSCGLGLCELGFLFGPPERDAIPWDGGRAGTGGGEGTLGPPGLSLMCAEHLRNSIWWGM